MLRTGHPKRLLASPTTGFCAMRTAAVPRQDGFTGAIMVISFARLRKEPAIAHLCGAQLWMSNVVELRRSLQLLTYEVVPCRFLCRQRVGRA